MVTDLLLIILNSHSNHQQRAGAAQDGNLESLSSQFSVFALWKPNQDKKMPKQIQYKDKTWKPVAVIWYHWHCFNSQSGWGPEAPLSVPESRLQIVLDQILVILETEARFKFLNWLRWNLSDFRDWGQI